MPYFTAAYCVAQVLDRHLRSTVVEGTLKSASARLQPLLWSPAGRVRVPLLRSSGRGNWDSSDVKI